MKSENKNFSGGSPNTLFSNSGTGRKKHVTIPEDSWDEIQDSTEETKLFYKNLQYTQSKEISTVLTEMVKLR